MILTIALDGPVGVGKSSVADDVARKLGILHLDTGAMYRAFAWYALKQGISVEDEQALTRLTAQAMPEVRYQDGVQHTLIAGQDVTDVIRTPEISMAASSVSRFAGVRRAMVAAQQALARRQSVLLDGRDIGTVVLPNATLKIYLTASAEVRARRRFDQLQKTGDPSTYEEVLADVNRRDEQDMNRQVTPLRPADDAQILDTSELTQAQVVAEIVRRVQLKRGRRLESAEDIGKFYRFARWALKWLCRVFYPTQYHNVENAQLDAPYILIANHQSFVDPILVAIPIQRYHLRILGKKELLNNPVMARLFKILRAIPVDRHNMDMGAVRACLQTLKEGHALCIFPEGTRHKTGMMQDIESGASMIALRSGARLLPAYIAGKPRLFRKTHVYFRAPLSVGDIAAGGINREACDAVSRRITAVYSEMIRQHENSRKA